MSSRDPPKEAIVERPGFFKRFGMAWRLLFDAALAGRLSRHLDEGPGAEPALPPPEPEAPRPKTGPKPKPGTKALDESAAIRLLAALQREGRFVDFVMEDLGPDTADEDIGAAARLVHEGCRKAVRAWFTSG